MTTKEVIQRLKEIQIEYNEVLKNLENGENLTGKELLLPLIQQRYDALKFAISKLEKENA